MVFTTKDKKFFEKTLKLASTSEKTYRVGAIITNGNTIVSSGVNVSKTHPLQFHCNNITKRLGEHYACTKHAEISALVDLPRNFKVTKKTAIYIARVIAKGDIGMARPCVSCMEALKKYGIQNIYYTATDGGFIYEYLDI